MSIKDISTIVTTTSAAKKLRPVFESWTEVLDAYCRRESYEDALWWYNERATLSSFAGAAWRVPSKRWMAIEEFSSTKRKRAKPMGKTADALSPVEGKVESGVVGVGRVDLYLSNGSTSFAIEAKQAWQPVKGRPGDGGTYMRKAIDGAWHDAGRLTADEADHRFACTFVVPHFSAKVLSQKNGDISELLQEWLDSEVRGGAKQSFDAVVCHFPAKTRSLVSHNTNIFPGVVLLIQERRRGVKVSGAKGG